MRMTSAELIENHGRVASYVASVAAELVHFADSAEPPEGFPASMTEHVQAQARQFAEILESAVEVLTAPPVVMTAIAAQLQARQTAEPEAEIRLTSRKVAQA